MPYEIAFTRLVALADRDDYINECCVGGDAVVDALFPAVFAAGYDSIQRNQEDWGWFIWFKKGSVKLAVDVHTDDGDAGKFRIRLTSQTKGFLGYKEADTPELDELLRLVEFELKRWSATGIAVSKD